MADPGPADHPAAEACWLTFLSDYGYDDVQVGVCHGVVARLAPQVRVIDVCHAVAAGDVEHGAMMLAAAVPYLPVGVHLAAVDPIRAEGSARPVAVRCSDGSTFVAPDNGLTSRPLLRPAPRRIFDVGRVTARLSGSFRSPAGTPDGYG